jgi:hypothetical protein
MAIEEIYKNHHIYASAWLLTYRREWEPRVFINWEEGSHALDKLPTHGKYFPTRAEAENYGLALAKQWIEDGKPES